MGLNYLKLLSSDIIVSRFISCAIKGPPISYRLWKAGNFSHHHFWWGRCNRKKKHGCLNHGRLPVISWDYNGIIIETGIILTVIIPIILVGGIPTPLKNMSSSIGVTIPNTWKVIKIMFQTTNQMKTTLTHYSKDSEKLPFTIISYMFVSFGLLFHAEKAWKNQTLTLAACRKVTVPVPSHWNQGAYAQEKDSSGDGLEFPMEHFQWFTWDKER